MVLVLETAAHPVSERIELVHDVIKARGVPTTVAVDGTPAEVDLRMEVWQLGSVPVLRTRGTGLHLTRSARQLRRANSSELFAVSLAFGATVHTACGVTQHYRRGDCHLNDLTGPTDIAHRGRGGSFIVHLSNDQVGLPVDTVRAALPRLRSSPLFPLVQGHLRHLSEGIEVFAADEATGVALSSATQDLVRALVVSAAGDRRERAVLRETLRARVVAHVRRHLREPDLSPARIARAHHVSVRTLYDVWDARDGTVMDWIVRQRLEGARGDLADASTRGDTIAAVAHRWGFRDPAHFSRRFRAAYGLPPGEWRDSLRAEHGRDAISHGPGARR